MILLVGVFLGLLGGLVRAGLEKRPYTLPTIQRVGLAMLAFLPQAFVFFVPLTGRFVSHQWAALILPLSLAILVIFAWFNRHLQGFWLLGVGLLLNFAVITANGGLMPINPDTLATVHGARAEEVIENRAFGTKNIVRPVEETRLEWLADRFTVPEEWPIQFAFSLGDVFLAIGAFWTLWVGRAQATRHVSGLIQREHYSS